MNGSKHCGLSGDRLASGEVLTPFAQRASTFPSPRPSPSGSSGRGRIIRWLSAQPIAVSARLSSLRTEPAAACSLSPWERVRVRGIGLLFGTGTRTIPDIAVARRPWRSLIRPALSVLFITLLSSSGPLCPARAHSFLSNPPIIWPNGDVVVVLKLGTPGHTLIDGNTSWESLAGQALSTWNSHLGTIQFSPVIQNPGVGSDNDHVNQVFFSPRVYGESFGGLVLAVTTIWHDGTTRTESDVVFNTAVSWDSYRGPSRRVGGKLLGDFYRVALHEFGHVLGLDHPDQAGQTVSAIMNSVVSDLDNLTADDIDGAQELYPPQPPVITMQPRTESGLFHLKMTGLANRNHIIQASTDLVVWVSLATNSVTNGELDFTDTNLLNSSARFYRALVAP